MSVIAMGNEPVLNVGIISAETISFCLNSQYRINSEDVLLSGKYQAEISGSKMILKQDNFVKEYSDLVEMYPVANQASFKLFNVKIGINFHWERTEDQQFTGGIRLIIENELVTLINVVSVEDYLLSVISSEMKATASEQFLKAHAVISRSWLLAQIEKHKNISKVYEGFRSSFADENEIVRWYDREDHVNFDVCADDHCQRYQGITRAYSSVVQKVIRETYGEILTFNNEICDARFHKCCGGATELFENTWEPVNHPYLINIIDSQENGSRRGHSLENEDDAREWIMGKSTTFCNTNDKQVLSQVLNDYDQETTDFFRWDVKYSQDELSELIKLKTGIDFGLINNLEPLKRGASGRIIRLRITGSEKTLIIGKELEIRKALSKSHLYSSCFYVEKKNEADNIIFILHGAGWGHGVGLCQIGAAVMGSKGFTYREILQHYFRGTVLEKSY